MHDGFSKVSEEAMEREVSKALLKAHDSGAEIDFTVQGPGVGPVLNAIKKQEGKERGGEGPSPVPVIMIRYVDS